MGKWNRGTGILLVVTMAACGDGPGAPPEEILIEPAQLEFCCDPSATGPQTIGDVTFTNMSRQGIGISLPPYDGIGSTIFNGMVVYLEGETTAPFTDTLTTTKCGDQSVTYELATDPASTHTVEILDRCPATVEDPITSGIDPSLDIRVCSGAHGPNGEAWFTCEVEGSWRPPESLYSWFVRLTLTSASDAVLHECVFQRHDGVEMTYCDEGNVDDFHPEDFATGFLAVFDNVNSVAGSTFTIEAGALPTSTGSLVTNMVVGTFEEDLVSIPEEL